LLLNHPNQKRKEDLSNNSQLKTAEMKRESLDRERYQRRDGAMITFMAACVQTKRWLSGPAVCWGTK
jgi:hypothetical protein